MTALPAFRPEEPEDPAHERPMLRLVEAEATAAAEAPAERIPEPHPALVRAIALQAHESIEGVRSIASLGGSITQAVAQHLHERRQLRDDQRRRNRDPRVVHAHPHSVHLSRPAPRITEATVVCFARGHAFAVALRLEWLNRRWRATTIWSL